MQLAFLGLGSMGTAIAENLVRARHALTVWNRSPDKARSLVALGAIAAASPKEAAAAKLYITAAGDPADLQRIREPLTF